MYVFSVSQPPPHVPRPKIEPKPDHRRQALQRVRPWLIALGVATALVAVLGLVVGPAVFGYRTSVMPAASGMVGTVNPGDIVVSVPRAADELRVGDVVTVTAPGGQQSVTHRIVSLRRGHGGVVLKTQGDSQADPDPWLTTVSDDVWVTAYTVPKLGHVANGVHALVVRYGALWVAAGGVLLLALSLIHKGAPRRAPAPERRTPLRLVTTETRR